MGDVLWMYVYKVGGIEVGTAERKRKEKKKKEECNDASLKEMN